MHDGGVQAGLDAFVQEDRIEHDSSGRVETEGDVGQAERGLHVREEPLDFANRLDGLDAVPASFLLAGGDGECEASRG